MMNTQNILVQRNTLLTASDNRDWRKLTNFQLIKKYKGARKINVQ